jgi:uncharacterized protein YprB with RNaseH-like and TPR domain
MGDLWERLRAVKIPDKRAEPVSQPLAEPAPEGWRWVTPLVAARNLTFGLEPQFCRFIAGLDLEAWENLLCFDTETTGLSGGAGTVAFLVGWARLTLKSAGPQVEVSQWFLRDLPGEPDLMNALEEAFTQARGLVSFNGASFDLPLLRSRWALAGKEFPRLPHRDDLHPSRRLWKRLLDSCRLGEIEASLLGIRRTDDVPGSLVPVLWFDYLRKGASADFATPLSGVLRHHAQDVYSLLCLDLLLAKIRQDPGGPWEEAWGPPSPKITPARLGPAGLLHPSLAPTLSVDFWGLLTLRDEAGRVASLERAWVFRRSEPVGMALADRFKRIQDPRCALLWRELWEGARSYPALVEWLKWLEHRERTLEAKALALGLIAEALKAAFLPRVWRENLEKRRTRLEKGSPI